MPNTCLAAGIHAIPGSAASERPAAEAFERMLSLFAQSDSNAADLLRPLLVVRCASAGQNCEDCRLRLEEDFETEEEARDFGLMWCDNYVAGGEALHLHNPGDYPLKNDEDVDFEVIEVDT